MGKLTKHLKSWMVFIVVLIPASGVLLVTCSAAGVVPDSSTYAAISPVRSSLQNPATSCGALTSMLVEPFYGLEFVPVEDLSLVGDLGIEVVLKDFPHDGTPADWLAYLDAAQDQDIQVVPWLWPEGWSWNGVAWWIDAQARLFVQTVAGHPALFAVYALHEPYWNGCEGCGYTTVEQQALYDAIKAIADVPIYSEINGIAEWTARGQATAFADGICDYCQSSYFPFKDGGVYLRDELIAAMTADLEVVREQAPNSRLVWTMPTLVYPPDNFRMPTADEMRDHAAIVYSREVAGAWWYPWTFDGHYDDFLVNHPELYPVVGEVYQEYVLPAKDLHCIYLPIVFRN